jgi:hypothetical protein
MFVAFKEIRRSFGRFSLLTMAVALLVLLLLFFQAVAGTLTSGLTGGLESSSADVFVYDVQARSNPATSVLSPKVEAEMAAAPDVAATSPIGLSVFTGTVEGSSSADPAAEIDVQLVGGDPVRPVGAGQHRRWTASVGAGRGTVQRLVVRQPDRDRPAGQGGRRQLQGGRHRRRRGLQRAAHPVRALRGLREGVAGSGPAGRSTCALAHRGHRCRRVPTRQGRPSR